jgi:hypothetical protein
MNIERLHLTTVAADDLAETLAPATTAAAQDATGGLSGLWPSMREQGGRRPV